MAFALILIAGVCLAILTFICGYAMGKQRTKKKELEWQVESAELTALRQSEKELRAENTKLQNQSRSVSEDPVTHLLSWQLFEDRLHQNIKESARYQLTMGVLFIDIDNFKVINDALSYEVGDALLKEVAERLQSSIRQVDSITRFTKDTFVVLLAQLSKPETAALVAQRILQSLNEPFQITDNELYITACIGIAVYPTDGDDAAALLRSADHALHLAKEKGKHLYQFYQEDLHVKSQRELMLYTSLNRETIFQELAIYYQPIINIQTKTMAYIDALLYWQHANFALIGPDELFNHAEKQRKLNSICEWLLKNACKQFQNWQSIGFKVPLLGIQLTTRQLENSHFVYQLSQILQEAKFNPESLLLEIKNTANILSYEILEKSFNMLNYLGIKIAIDDFGSGAFALTHLKNFTVHYLKLAPSLIEDIENNEQAVAIIRSIIFLAKNMNIQVIAQGVDREPQVTILRELGCELLQGKFLGAPLPENEITTKIAVAPVSF